MYACTSPICPLQPHVLQPATPRAPACSQSCVPRLQLCVSRRQPRLHTRPVAWAARGAPRGLDLSPTLTLTPTLTPTLTLALTLTLPLPLTCSASPPARMRVVRYLPLAPRSLLPAPCYPVPSTRYLPLATYHLRLTAHYSLLTIGMPLRTRVEAVPAAMPTEWVAAYVKVVVRLW